MPQVNSKIQFKSGSYADYLARKQAVPSQINSNAIYFCSDTAQLFVGGTEYSRPVAVGSGAPVTAMLSLIPPQSFYWDNTNKKMYFNLNDSWEPIDSGVALTEGVLPEFSSTVENENLTFAWSAGEYPKLQ